VDIILRLCAQTAHQTGMLCFIYVIVTGGVVKISVIDFIVFNIIVVEVIVVVDVVVVSISFRPSQCCCSGRTLSSSRRRS